MKVLLLYPEAPDSFWSFKEHCKNLGRKALLPPLGLVTVAALLPAAWDFRLVDLNGRQLTPEDWDWADLVMISGMLIHKPGVLALIRESKAHHKTVAVGGPYATSLPQEVIEAGADFLILGECESTIPLFLQALEEGKKSGVIREEAKPDMALSPVPRFDLLNLADYEVLSIQTSRGCPFNCEFCDVVNLFGRKPRYKQPQQVIAELEAIYRLGFRGTMFISDDNFIGNKDHTRAILDLLIPWMKSHGEPFSYWTQASVNLGQDLEMIDLLTAANFSTIFLGVESPDEELLKLNRKYQNINNPVAQSIANISANGLTPMASFVLGFDQEKPGAGERICEFVERNHIPLVVLNTLHVLPNTSLWERLRRQGRLLESKAPGDMNLLRGLNYVPDRPEAEILGEYVRAVNRLYDPSRYFYRLYMHCLTMRPTRRYLKDREAGPRQVPRQKQQLPLRGELKAFLTLAKLFWRHGVLAPYRRQFWWQVWDLKRKNPSRLKRYLINCFVGESIFWVRREVLRLAAAESRHWGIITYTPECAGEQDQERSLKAATT
jgi:radical SAM superfamily enzyme YgiQ (UPF0313 family)